MSYKAKEIADKNIAERNNAITGDVKIKDVIHWFGPQLKMYSFMVRSRKWGTKKIDKVSSMYKGGLKHFALVAIPEQ